MAEDDGDGSAVVVGYAGLIAYDDEAHVATLGVATEALQGEGIGSLLLDALLAEADKRSPVVLLEVRADNEVALSASTSDAGSSRSAGGAATTSRAATDAVVMKRKRVRSIGGRAVGVEGA